MNKYALGWRGIMTREKRSRARGILQWALFIFICFLIMGTFHG